MRGWIVALGLLVSACFYDPTGAEPASSTAIVTSSTTSAVNTDTSISSTPTSSSTTTAPLDDTTTTTAAPDSTSTTSETTTTGVPVECGNGRVEDDEQCDDGNQDDTDACTTHCELAACGDGFVHAGAEQCDDANQDDTDTCKANCELAVCGDGFVHAGVEQCDDTNQDDTDACTTYCSAAACGDGFVHAGVEMCDDQNSDDLDGCTTGCLWTSCADQSKNNDESDIDCGGSCPKCPYGDVCLKNADCASSLCKSGKCRHPPSCEALLVQGKPSGQYTLETAGGVAYDVWCEQDFAGGGWTLVLKASGLTDAFEYDDAKWTSTLPWMPDPDLDRTETKLQSFASLPVNEVLVAMESPIQAGGALDLSYIQLSLGTTATSLRSVFQAGTMVMTNSPYISWTALVPDASLQTSCRREGFNMQANVNPAAYARARIGIIGNEQTNCDSHNSFIGVGGSPNTACNHSFAATTGNGAHCSADEGDRDTAAFAFVYVR